MAAIARRAVLAGAVALGIAARAGAAMPGALNGAVGLTCGRDGLTGMLLAGEDGALLDPALRWHLGSNTKAMTAALYARLVERERCRWEATLPALFPGMAIDPAWHDVRVEELMTHTAGMTDEAIDGAWLEARHRDAAPVRVQRRAFAAAILGAPPRGERGRYRYGNAHFVILGAAVEQAVDADWEDVLRRELLAPLGMAETGFGAPPRDGLWGREEAGGALRAVDPTGVADNPPVLWPSGGIHLTAGDYARFLSLFLREGAPLLRADTLAHLLTPAAAGAGYAGGWLLAGAPDRPDAVLAHDGSNTLWYATARVERAAGRGYAAVVNRGGDSGAAITARLLARLRGAMPSS